MQVAGFVLAGGKSTRMGRDKALLEFEGETLIERGLRKLGAVCGEVAIAGGTPDLARFARVIPDQTPGRGPLGGVVAALEQSRCELNLFLAVDMPSVPLEVLRGLVRAAHGRSLVNLAEARGTMQPLCGVYRRAATLALRSELAAGRLKMKDAVMATGAVTLVPFRDELWFRNLNTPDDFLAAGGLR